MSAIFRHFGVRLWLTALVGGMVCAMLLPQWQRLAAMDWIALPVLAVLAALFFVTGWMMDLTGRTLIRRQVAEAAVWDRAGMVAEAEGAFERTKALYDSFWFSPAGRRRSAELVAMRLARFHLAQPNLDAAGRAVVAAYLWMRPTDEAIAHGWLEEVCRRQIADPQAHELAAHIGNALASREKIQTLLAEYYLSLRRTDFDAMQTYRRVWQLFDVRSSEWVCALSDLLLQLGYINDWALQVYLEGYRHGNRGCLDGLAAAHSHLRPNSDNRADLVAAAQALSQLSGEQVRTMAARFKAPEPPARPVPPRPQRKSESLVLARRAWQYAAAVGRQTWGLGVLGARRMAAWRERLPVRMRWMALLVPIGIAALWWAVAHWPATEPVVPESPPAAVPVAEPEPAEPHPFTIQVAAYLKNDDAQRFVDQLKQAGVDAFWTRAKSAQRTWYQVKVSHFATQDEARRYGESLKTRGLIDDFYVANHRP